ncbi:acyl-CoA N-acyltransferases superfamily protein [Tanacetum coccineum]
MASTPFSFSSSVVHHLPQQPSYSKYRPRYNPMLTCSYHSSSSSTIHEDELPTSKLLLNSSQKREFLENFKIFHKLPSGSMLMIRVMEQQEKYMKAQFVAECLAHEIAKRAIFVPKAYEEDFACFMKIDLIEGPPLPNAVTLIAFHARDTDELGGELENEHIAGTIEVKFNWSGDEVSPLTPSPPRNAPYVNYLAVKKSLTGEDIGWHLVKASEELISNMTSVREVYSHCRPKSSGLINLFFGYSVCKTGSILKLLKLKRRFHLICKQLPPASNIAAETAPTVA